MSKPKIAAWTMIPLSITMIVGAVFALLFYHGILLFNNPSTKEYPVRGVDVSSYQGEIDWQVLAAQNIHFAFIKATEGSSFVDPYFRQNSGRARQTELRIGAYHFFSFDSAGQTQAENFIRTVPKADGMLPPVVDFEFYINTQSDISDASKVRIELDVLLHAMESHYGAKPIIYATEECYRLYLAGYYAEYDIWIRNVRTRPAKLNNQTWTFWQYTNRERLDGYVGKERFIDMNVFKGTIEEFAKYGR